MNQVAVFVVPGTFILFQLLAGAELFPDAEDTGEDTFGRDLQIGREEGPPVELFRSSAFKTEDVIDRGNHKVKVLGPIYETAGRLFALVTMTRINEVSEGLEGGFCVRRSVPFWASFASYIKHSEQGCGLVCIGEIRIIEHDEDLEDHAEVRADRVFTAGDGDGSG